MYAYLKGILVEKTPPTVVIDVGGVGYLVDAPMGTFADLAEVGSEVLLHTHLIVREDAHTLFGFSKAVDKALFIQLLKVNGVGPRMALGILSGLSPSEFQLAIENGEVDRLVKIPGVGRKTAERLVVELRGRFEGIGTEFSPTANDSRGDAQSALIALGYKAKDAQKAINAIEGDQLSSEALIREALKRLTGGGR